MIFSLPSRSWLPLGAVLLLAWAVAGCRSEGPSERLDTGTAALSGGTAEDASGDESAALRAAVRANPADPRPRVTLIAHLARAGRRCDALEEAQSAFAAFPESGPVRLALAQALGDMERFAEAAAVLRPLVEISPDYRLRVARYLLRSGDPSGAVATLRPLLRSGVALQAGQMCLDALHFEDAHRFFVAAAGNHRHDPDLQAHLGLSLLLRGRYRDAVKPLRQAAEGQPQQPAVHYYLGAALRLGGSPAAAVEPLRTAVRLEPRAGIHHHELGLALLETGHAEEAVTELREAAALEPSAPEIQRDLARACAKSGQSLVAAGARGRYLRLLGDGRGAAAVLASAAKANPASIPLALELAEAHYDAWESPKTLAILESRRRQSPGDRSVREALFRARKAAHHHQQALEVLDGLIAESPDDLSLLEQRADLLQLMARGDDLEKLLDDLRKKQPDSAIRHYRYGVALMQWSTRSDRAAAAEQAFREAIRLDPKLGDPYYRLGLLQQAQGRTDEAIRSFRECLDRDPRSADAMLALSRAYSLAGDRKRAAEFRKAYDPRKEEADEEARLKEPATLRPPTGAERRALGLFYLRELRYNAAAQELERAAHLGALSSAERRKLADLYGHLRRFERMHEERSGVAS